MPQRAAMLLGAVRTICDVLRSKLLPYDEEQNNRYMEEVRNVLTPKPFEAEFEKGRSLTMDQAIALALDETQG